METFPGLLNPLSRGDNVTEIEHIEASQSYIRSVAALLLVAAGLMQMVDNRRNCGQALYRIRKLIHALLDLSIIH